MAYIVIIGEDIPIGDTIAWGEDGRVCRWREGLVAIGMAVVPLHAGEEVGLDDPEYIFTQGTITSSRNITFSADDET